MAQVFISYKAEEAREAESVKQVLETNGISCWLAPASIPGGSNYAREIPKAIHDCKVFVLLLSEKAQSSKWVPRELDQAVNENKVIMPFMLENCSLQDDFNFYLSNVQRYKAYENKSATLKKMVMEINAILALEWKENDVQSEASQATTQIQTARKTDDTIGCETQTGQNETEKKRQKKQLSKRARLLLKVTLSVVLALVSVMAILTGYVINRFTICGQFQFGNVQEDYIELEGKIISHSDAKKICNLSFHRLYLNHCKAEPEDMVLILNQTRCCEYFLTDCGLTDEILAAVHWEDHHSIDDLDIEYNEITSLQPLQPLKESLINLYADYNHIKSLAGLKGFHKLEILYIDHNEITDFAGLEECSNLKRLSAKAEKLVSTRGLRSDSLEQIDVSENQLKEIDFVTAAKSRLTSLLAQNNELSDISVLSTCQELRNLNIENNHISSLESLASCQRLVTLSANKNRLTDLKGLNSQKLTVIELADNQITNADALAKLKSIDKKHIYINLVGNPLQSMRLAKGIDYHLFLFNTEITDFSFLKEAGSVDLEITYQYEIDFYVMANYPIHSLVLADCPGEFKEDIKGLFEEMEWDDFIEKGCSPNEKSNFRVLEDIKRWA